MRTEYPELLGKTMANVTADHDTMTFETSEGERYRFYHQQSCCEDVSIDDICGELSDLVGSPLIVAEEVSGTPPERQNRAESETWTFYRFATAKGWVNVRWYGRSNGYYSESVNFCKI